MKYPIWYTEKGMTGGTIGWQYCFLLAIHPDYKGDEGLRQHELTHIAQWAFTALLVGGILFVGVYFLAKFIPWTYGITMGLIATGAHGALYARLPAYRFWCEVMAFKKQLRYYPDDRALKFADFISRNYKLDVSFAEALERLRS